MKLPLHKPKIVAIMADLPGIDLGISAFTDHDRACLEFAPGAGVDAVSQSFVEEAATMLAKIAAFTEARRSRGTLAKERQLVARTSIQMAQFPQRV